MVEIAIIGSDMQEVIILMCFCLKFPNYFQKVTYVNLKLDGCMVSLLWVMLIYLMFGCH